MLTSGNHDKEKRKMEKRELYFVRTNDKSLFEYLCGTWCTASREEAEAWAIELTIRRPDYEHGAIEIVRASVILEELEASPWPERPWPAPAEEGEEE
jgi:hypothetical protein